MGAQSGGDLVDAGAPEEAEGGITEKAMTMGPCPQWRVLWSSPGVTSLTRCNWFSMAQCPRLSASRRSGGPVWGVRLVIP